MRKLFLFFFFFTAVFFSRVSIAKAQNQQDTVGQLTPAVITQNPQQSIDNIFLDRTLKHEELVDKDIERFFDVVDRVIDLAKWLVGGSIVAGIAAFLTVLKRASDVATKAVEKRLHEMDLNPHIERSTNHIINTRLGLKKKISLIGDLSDVGASKVLRVSSHLTAAGFTNLHSTEDIQVASNADLIVFVYQPELQKKLEKLLKSLAKKDTLTPVIVYYRKRLETQMLENYEFVTPANSLLTLASWTLTIASTTANQKEAK